ncbi:MAG: hypothetical protein ACLSG5_08875 [Oscillospiraceae bacterium]
MSDNYSIDDILAEIDRKRGGGSKSTESVTEIISEAELHSAMNSTSHTRMPSAEESEPVSGDEEARERAESIRRAAEANRRKAENKRREREERQQEQRRLEQERAEQEQRMQFSEPEKPAEPSTAATPPSFRRRLRRQSCSGSRSLQSRSASFSRRASMSSRM